GLQGFIRIARVGWTGRFEDLRRGRALWSPIALEAGLAQVSGCFPFLGLQVKQTKGRIKMNADEIVLSDINFTLRDSPIVLNGSITGPTRRPRVDLFISMKTLVQDISPILRTETVAGLMPDWIKKVKDPEGEISVTLDIKGPLASPSVKGRIAVDELQFALDGLPVPIRGVKGTFKFKESQVAFTDVEGVLGDSDCHLSGSISSEKVSVECLAKLSLEDFKEIAALSDSLTVSGKAACSVRIYGKPEEVGFNVKVDLKDNRVGWDWYIRKRPGLPLTLEASGIWDSKGVRIEDAYAVFGACRVAGKGSFDESGKADFRVHLPPSGIETASIAPFVNPALDLKAGGRLEGDMSVRWGQEGSQERIIDANLVFNHVSVQLFGLHKPESGLTGRIKLRGGRFRAVIDRGRIGNTTFSGTCSIQGARNPQVELDVEYQFLDTTDFESPQGAAVDRGWGDWIRNNGSVRFLARSVGQGRVRVLKGKTSTRTFSDFHTTVEANRGVLLCKEWKAAIAGGIVSGTATFDITEETQTPLRMRFHGDHMSLDRLLDADPKHVNVEGTVQMDGSLDWHLTRSRENRGIQKTGTVDVVVAKGLVHRFDTLSKIFSSINFGSLVRGRLPEVGTEGFPFQQCKWRMEVIGNKWKIKDMKMRSDAAGIGASGMYFSDQGRVDLKVEVAPLVGLDALFSGIFGDLLTKDGKTLTTTFRVRGLVSSPDVRLVAPGPFKSE
ncbi:MAG: AsmA-like C-terminal region-containing protein, partial [Pseudomonadota bacterium]